MGEEKTYSLSYHRLILTDLKEIDSYWRRRIEDAIEGKLTMRPDFFGKPLRRSLKGCRSMRVEDYRVIYQIAGTIVKIVIIGNRRDVYQRAEKRK